MRFAAAAVALGSALAWSAPLADAQAVGQHHPGGSSHNQVHAAHINHVRAGGQAARGAKSASALPGAQSGGSSSKGKAKGSVDDALASSNKLGASMRVASTSFASSDETATIYSFGNGGATELIGTGTDTLYSSNATACSRRYTVADTDTCDIIGHKTHTSTYQIMALNLDKTGPQCYGLEAGMSLCLGRFGSDCQLVHRVRSDESCADIEKRYSISRDVLLRNNPNLDCPNIYDGLNLCVAPGFVAPPRPRGLYVARRSEIL